MKFIFKLILLFLFVPLLGIGQTKQKDLEQRKKALLEQIKQMSALRQQQSQQRKSTIQQIEEANEKILHLRCILMCYLAYESTVVCAYTR